MREQIEYYNIKQATRFAGYDSTYMVDYLCKQKLIVPIAESGRGRGRPRFFTFQDLVILRIYRKMFEAGVSVLRLKEALDESKDFQALRITRKQRRYGWKEANLLIADSKRVFIRTNNNDLVQAQSGGQFVFSFMVNIKDIQMELSEKTENVVHYRKRENGQGFRRYLGSIV